MLIYSSSLKDASHYKSPVDKAVYTFTVLVKVDWPYFLQCFFIQRQQGEKYLPGFYQFTNVALEKDDGLKTK